MCEVKKRVYYPFCCEKMEWLIKDSSNILIKYTPKYRLYEILSLKGESIKKYVPFSYCIYCGNLIPKNFIQEWHEILQSQWGISDPHGSQIHLVPKEFKSDRWWKKRGLN